MSAPVRPPLKTQLDNDTSENRPVNTIAFANTDFTLTNSGTKTTVALSGGGSATLTDTYVGFGSGSNVLTGDATFTWDNTNKKLTLTSTDAGADAAPEIEFYRNSASPASDDKLGGLLFTGENSAGAKVTYAQMYAQIDNAVAGSHDGRLVIDVVSNAASPINVFRADKDEIIINDVSFALDTRIESNGNANMFVIDGSTDTVGIGGGATGDSTLAIYAGTTAGDATLELISTQDDLNAAPIMQFFRDDTPSGSDQTLGEIEFYGRDLGGTRLRMAQISAFVNDATAGGVESTLKFQALRTSSARELAQWDSYLTDFNPQGADIDFRIRSNNRASMFELNGGTDTIGIYSAPTTGLADNNPVLQVEGSISGKMPIIISNSDVTLTRAGLSGQTYVITDGGTTALTMPLGALQGDYFYFVASSGSTQIVVDVGTQTLNGGTSPLTRTTNNEVYTVICIQDDKFILSNPA
jgi:hypothetical protein